MIKIESSGVQLTMKMVSDCLAAVAEQMQIEGIQKIRFKKSNIAIYTRSRVYTAPHHCKHNVKLAFSHIRLISMRES